MCHVIGYHTGRRLSMLPVEPKLGKMLILGAIFKCLDPIMTVVAGLSVRDPFLMPYDKKDVSWLTLFICIFSKEIYHDLKHTHSPSPLAPVCAW